MNNKTALLIAYHFPPVKVSSGLQRTLKNVQYLAEFGWTPAVLSAHPRVFEEQSQEQVHEIPQNVTVIRAAAWDTKRHLALAGRYPGFLALPDRWVGWWLGGVIQGLSLIRRLRPAVLWSTYPIATAHLIGLTLHRLTGIPWVADFRDSMTEPDYPRDPRQRRVFLWIERQVARYCARAVFTAPSALKMYRDRYPDSPGIARGIVIPNGYDEGNFAEAQAMREHGEEIGRTLLTFVHSGVLYPKERDPTAFFDALAQLKKDGMVSAKTLRIVLRATGHDDLYEGELESRNIDDIVELAPPLAYAQALAEMLEADGLLLFQASSCNHQIPAKLYEYFRSRRPILALTDPAGDTAATLAEAGVDTVVPLDDSKAISAAMKDFIARAALGTLPVADEEVALRYSRRALTGRLARVFDELAEQGR